MIPGGVSAFLEIHTESLSTRPAHSDSERQAKGELARFISPFLIKVFEAKPMLSVFEIDFSRYHSKPSPSMKQLGIGMENVLDTSNKSGKHIAIRGSRATMISPHRDFGKGIQYLFYIALRILRYRHDG